MKNKNSKRRPDQTKNAARPWLDPDGNLYSNDALREVSKSWDQETWEKFLSATVDGVTQETMLTPYKYDEICEEDSETIFEQAVDDRRPAPAKITHLIEGLLRRLTHQQARILKEIYWEDRSVCEVARRLNLDAKQIRVQHSRSLKKLKDLLKTRTPTHTYSEGQRRFLAEIFTPIEAPQTRDEQIREVYREECQMRFFKC